MTPGVHTAVFVVATFLGTVVVPWVGMRLLMPTLESRDSLAVENYRGRRVVYGLGFVWLFWVIGVGLASSALRILVRYTSDGQPLAMSGLGYLRMTSPFLVLGALVLGLLDDFFGSGDARGFRGHLSELRHGRLTTGGMKLFGIGLIAAVVSMPWAFSSTGQHSAPWAFIEWLLAICAISLSANLVNLTDLRPGRALKTYSFATCLLVLASFVTKDVHTILPTLFLLLGPVVAVWRYDLGERAMLGDAGANAAGALLGWIAVRVLEEPLALAVYVAVVLALNLASEKVSFSRIIERNPFLSWVDGLGRLPADAEETVDAEKSSREVEATEK